MAQPGIKLLWYKGQFYQKLDGEQSADGDIWTNRRESHMKMANNI
jgi:hypothetical protein